jgi:short-subunit dehydrogenase
MSQERRSTNDRERALVTGVGRGTGTSIVRRFVEGGYDVAMIARNEERLRQLEAKIGRRR